MKPLQNILTQFTQHTIQQPSNNIIEQPQKSTLKKVKKIKKKKPKKTIVSINIDSDIEDEIKDPTSMAIIPINKAEIDIENELQIAALKIKIKLFISEKIESRKSVQQDVFSLLNLILLKHKIILTEDEKFVFPRLFQRIYKEHLYKQKIILKDIVNYLVDCKFDSYFN